MLLFQVGPIHIHDRTSLQNGISRQGPHDKSALKNAAKGLCPNRGHLVLIPPPHLSPSALFCEALRTWYIGVRGHPGPAQLQEVETQGSRSSDQHGNAYPHQKQAEVFNLERLWNAACACFGFGAAYSKRSGQAKEHKGQDERPRIAGMSECH